MLLLLLLLPFFVFGSGEMNKSGKRARTHRFVSSLSLSLFAREHTTVQCAFYFMNVAIDTTLGVYIAYLLLQLVTALAVRRACCLFVAVHAHSSVVVLCFIAYLCLSLVHSFYVIAGPSKLEQLEASRSIWQPTVLQSVVHPVAFVVWRAGRDEVLCWLGDLYLQHPAGADWFAAVLPCAPPPKDRALDCHDWVSTGHEYGAVLDPR